MDRRNASKFLLASAAGATFLGNQGVAQATTTCYEPCYPQTPAEQAASVTPDTKYPLGDVRRYGVVGDGVTDDRQGIQHAIDFAPASSAVFLPPHEAGGSYNVGAGLTISKPIQFVGSGPQKTTIKGVGLAAGDSVLHIDGTIDPNLEFVEVSNLTLTSDNSDPDLLKINRASNSAFCDIGLLNGNNGLLVTGNRTFSNLYERVITVSKSLGTTVKFENYMGGGHHTFTGCGFMGSYGLVIDGGSEVYGISLRSCNFEVFDFESIWCAGLVHGLDLSACRFEKNSGYSDILLDPVATKSVYGVKISGCYFQAGGPSAASYVVQLGGLGQPVRGFDISGNFALNYLQGFVRLNGDGESGVISGNRLDGTSSIVNTIRSGVLVFNNENELGKLGAEWNPPLTTNTYSINNVSTQRIYDANTVTTAELADVVGTLVADLRAVGLVK